MQRHVLVTGGTGLVGRPIVERLAAEDCQVTVLARRPPAESHQHVRWVSADLCGDVAGVLSALPHVDEVVHAAAAISDAGDAASLRTLVDTNIRASDALFGWCAERGVGRVVMIGSLSVLARPLHDPITESHPVGPSSPYAMSKLWSEMQLQRHAAAAGFTPIVLRISSPIPASFEAAPRTVVRLWIEAALRGEPLQVYGTGSRTQDFVSCADVAQAVWQAINAPGASGVYHIGSGVPLSMRDLAETIAQFRNSPISAGGEDPGENDRWQLSLERAREDLGYRPSQTGRQAIESLARLVL